jgi:hypothetical protein
MAARLQSNKVERAALVRVNYATQSANVGTILNMLTERCDELQECKGLFFSSNFGTKNKLLKNHLLQTLMHE